MIEISTIVPIIAITTVSMMFKETRWLGVVAIAAISYFAPLLFLVFGSVGAIAFGFYKLGGKS